MITVTSAGRIFLLLTYLFFVLLLNIFDAIAKVSDRTTPATGLINY